MKSKNIFRHSEQSEESISHSISTVKDSSVTSFSQNDGKKPAFNLKEATTRVGMANKLRKNAFTLAEVLITLGIIGIVAAMTMPVLMANYQKQENISKLKKTYSVFSQAIIQSENDNGEFENWETGGLIESNSYFEKYWKPYLNSAHICTTAKACGYKSNLPWKDIKGREIGWLMANGPSRISYMLNDGTFVFMPISTTGSVGNTVYVDYFYVDINGKNNPNVLGKDVFLLQPKSGGKGVSGYCSDLSEVFINNNCGNAEANSNVNCCTAKIINDGWQIKADYPW